MGIGTLRRHYRQEQKDKQVAIPAQSAPPVDVVVQPKKTETPAVFNTSKVKSAKKGE